MLIAQLVVNGVLLGGVLGLSALGFNLIFGVMRVVNLAHGDFVVLSAMLCAFAFAQWNVNPLLLLPLNALIGFGLGAAVHRYLLRRLPREIASSEASSLTLTFGLSFFLAGGGLALFGGSYRSIPFLTGAFYLGTLSIPQARLLAFVVALILAAFLGVFLRSTRVGRAIRATSQNLEGALACGVDTARVQTVAFALGTAVATTAGTLMSFLYSLNPQMGVLFTISAFAVVVVGGLGSYAGALLGAVVLGLAQSFASYFAGAALAEAAPYVLFIVVALLLPTGLFGRRTT